MKIYSNEAATPFPPKHWIRRKDGLEHIQPHLVLLRVHDKSALMPTLELYYTLRIRTKESAQFFNVCMPLRFMGTFEICKTVGSVKKTPLFKEKSFLEGQNTHKFK